MSQLTDQSMYMAAQDTFISDNITLQGAKAQLSSTTASQVDAVRSGLEVLNNAQKTLSMLRNCYAVCISELTELQRLKERFVECTKAV